MNIKTVGRKVNLKEHFLTTVEKRLEKFDRYFDADAEATVTVTVETNRQTVEITVKNKGFIYRAERAAEEMEDAFADAADSIDKQIVKHKSKLGTRIKAHEPEPVLETVDEFVDDEFRIVKEKRFELKPMTVEEAILRMNLLGHTFFIFQNIDGEVSVVYKRKDDDYGLLIPN